MSIKDTLYVLFIVCFMSLVSNILGTKATILESIPGLLILTAIALAGILMAKYLPGNIPSVAYVVTLGCILTYPAVPGSAIISAYVAKVGFVSLCTP
ncbi:MAG: DUF340 domain-containing protein, partial [Phascolarctobacterium sp.]|nr:DUF340 domain-containing protein [Phascolarctobacterium sp.]